MNKSLISLAVAAGLVTTGAAHAAPTLYGNVHVSVNSVDKNIPSTVSSESLDMTSNTSSFGVKGSEDLGDGLKAIYKVEYQVDAADGGSNGNSAGGGLSKRDQWVGLKGGFGTVALGTMSSNYKSQGGKVDPMYRTRLEGRGFLGTQSSLHSGRDINRGRMTNAVQYTSSSFGGVTVVVNTSLSGSGEETTGFGVRYKTKDLLVYLDTIDGQTGAATVGGPGGTSEGATKIGARFGGKDFSVSGQMEMAEDRTGYDYLFLAGSFSIDKNNSVSASVGQSTHITTAALDYTGIAIMFDHMMSKQTSVYAGFGQRSSDTVGLENDMATVGIRKKF